MDGGGTHTCESHALLSRSSFENTNKVNRSRTTQLFYWTQLRASHSPIWLTMHEPNASFSATGKEWEGRILILPFKSSLTHRCQSPWHIAPILLHGCQLRIWTKNGRRIETQSRWCLVAWRTTPWKPPFMCLCHGSITLSFCLFVCPMIDCFGH